MSKDRPLLDVRDLTVHFHTERGIARAVDGVSFSIGRGETFCLVGESGCGKSVTALSIMRLVPTPPGEIVAGSVLLDGRDLLGLSKRRMREVRGNRISMVFQEPMTALNPVFTIGNQIAEAVMLHRDVGRAEAREIAIDTLEKVRMPDAPRRMEEYAHEMSGGMQQRAMIAMALVCRPELLIADEPTTALDVTIQAQTLDLLRDLKDELGMSMLMITHDLGVVAEVADRVAVMYAGQIVERAPVLELFERPLHPYMANLLKAMPQKGSAGRPLNVIPGRVPDPRHHPSGCRFHPRCPLAVAACAEIEPELRQIAPAHRAACIRLEGYWDGEPPVRVETVDADTVSGVSDG